MTNLEEDIQKPTEDVTPEDIVEEYINWPVEFYVCARHKAEFFEDYSKAIVGRTDQCVLCHPIETDSLGG